MKSDFAISNVSNVNNLINLKPPFAKYVIIKDFKKRKNLLPNTAYKWTEVLQSDIENMYQSINSLKSPTKKKKKPQQNTGP